MQTELTYLQIGTNDENSSDVNFRITSVLVSKLIRT